MKVFVERDEEGRAVSVDLTGVPLSMLGSLLNACWERHSAIIAGGPPADRAERESAEAVLMMLSQFVEGVEGTVIVLADELKAEGVKGEICTDCKALGLPYDHKHQVPSDDAV